MSISPMSKNAITERGRMAAKDYDAILLASFGGPEGQDDVIPFLRNVTRGRGIPDERLEEVSHHYRAFGGISPINEQNRALKLALETELAARGIELPVLWGNRNWDPYIPEVLQEAYDAGHRRILTVTTSAYSCYSSCRQYREDLGMALVDSGLDGKLEVDKVRQYFDHPGFVEPFIEGTTAGLAKVRSELSSDEKIHVLFATHSIPTRDAEAAGNSAEEPREFAEGSAYVAQHLAAATAVMAQVDAASAEPTDWSLVYQSRSGAPHVPWLEPDISDAMEELAEQGVRGVVVVPLGFVSDHMEVVWDLDTEAKETAEKLNMAFDRVPTPGTHQKFVAGLVDLVCERTLANNIADRPAMTPLGPWYDVCRPGCCTNFRGEKPTIAGADTLVGTVAAASA
ncbi:ferrochelatase [Renibacterium salmoninarum ATCC 33209]|uniref:Coproporphyrin III ferrochelatase n=1 Tax=Renibacterium salmoninarum (strain ATCC 33209 / DSM 20767 / JCM 11484 / NBRC 15589 / NCIMB 2235) TaxID=288705 RepID=A9WPH5_RENSM|nr:ferrochelatase [Renibacterium salmoninarum]ABY22960.1 ferrochelatase [Renibacterium salmoninarum ATCC 33209]